MHARILPQSEEPKWSEFVLNHPYGNIHQTPQWAHFQAKVPARGKYWIVVVEEGETIVAGALIVRHSLPKGLCWLYAPRGPLLNYENDQEVQKQMETLLEAIKGLAKEEKAIFWRIDPALELNETSTPALASLALPFPHFHFIPHGFQPNNTLTLDLTLSEDQLLTQMKPKGRYNIRLAEKKGVKIHTADPASPTFHQDLSDFYAILKETTSRDGFSGHPQKYYEDMLRTLLPRGKNLEEQNSLVEPSSKAESLPGQTLPTSPQASPHAQLYLATFENQVIAGLLATTYKDTTIYYYGASGAAHRNVMAPYLLQWQAIRDAKANHCTTYDFLGISPKEENASARPVGLASARHPWAGVTDFKKKFGGHEIHYLQPQEFAFNKLLYKLFRLYKKLR